MYIVKKVWKDKRGNEEFEYLSGFYTSKEKAEPFIREYEEYYKSFLEEVLEEVSEVKTEFIEITSSRYFAVIKVYSNNRIDDLYGVFDGQHVTDFLMERGYSPDEETDIYIIPLTVNMEFEGYTNTF